MGTRTMQGSNMLRAALLALAIGQFTTTAHAAATTSSWYWWRYNRAPVISGTPATAVFVGSQYSFVPTASDPDGNTVRFTIRNAPAWATFDSTSGALQGTPQSSNVGTYSGITIYAS